MRAGGNGKSDCLEAREHYYDLLCHDDAAVPEAILQHIEQCPLCREQMNRLRDALCEAGDRTGSSSRPGEEEGALEALSRQFELLGEHVGCSQARPFLPDLLIPSHPIRVPTPITVHVEHCPQCAKDLASIHELDLTADQLARLSLFYRRSAERDRLPCGRAQSTVAALAAFSFEGADSEALDHVSGCPECRDGVHRRRAQAMAGLPAGPGGGGVLLCRDITMANLFDYVLPFSVDAPAIGGAHGRLDAVLTHVRACRPCMDKAQSLHETIYAIAERADAPVRTVCRSSDDAEDVCEQAQIPAYRYPIRVQVLDDSSAPAVARGGPRRRASAGLKVILPFKTVVTTAAAVAVALLLLVYAPSATGMSVRELIGAVERAGNVHIVSRRGDPPQPGYEVWMAKDRDLFARKTGRECTVYDLAKRSKTVIPPDLGPGAPVALKPDEIDRCRLFLSQIVFAGALESSNFTRVDDVPADRPGASLAVYELTEESRGKSGGVMLHQWRVFVDPGLQLPVRIEYARRDSRESSWEAVETTVLTYPGGARTESAIRALLRAP